jgi:hypothetical protein
MSIIVTTTIPIITTVATKRTVVIVTPEAEIRLREHVSEQELSKLRSRIKPSELEMQKP